MRFVQLSIICAFVFAGGKGYAQYPNQWLISEDAILDFSHSPPTFIQLPDTVVRDHPIDEYVVFELLASTQTGMLDYFTTGRVRIRQKIYFYDSDLDGELFGSSFKTAGRESGVYSIYSNLPFTQVSFPNGNNFTPVFLENTNEEQERRGLIKVKRETPDSLFMDSVATRSDHSSIFHRLVYFTDTSFLYLTVEGSNANRVEAVRILHVSQSGEVLEDVKTERGPYSAQDIIAANRSPFFVLSERNSDEIGTFLRLKFYKVESNLSVQKVHETIIRSQNQGVITFLDGAFSPNDSLFYFSYRAHYHEGFINGSVLARVDIFGNQSSKKVPLRDSMFIESIGCAPNGQLYFVHRHRDEDPKTWLGVIQYPDQKDIDNVGVNVKRHHGYDDRGGYEYGLSTKKYVNVPLLHYKSHQQDCRNEYITCHNWSDKEFETFAWELFDLDTNLVFTAKGKTAKLYPKTSGTYLVRLKGTDQHGKNSWRWQEVEFQKPYTFDFTTALDTACLWTDVNVKAELQSNPFQNASFTWTFYRNNSPVLSDTGKTLTTQFQQAGTYDIELAVNVDGCADAKRKSAEIVLIEAPKPGFSFSNDSLCTAQTVTVIDRSQGPVASAIYSWSDGPQFTGRGGHSRQFLNRGDYWLTQKLKGPTGCETADSSVLHIMQGVKDSTPALLLATVRDYQSIDIKWRAVRNIRGYELERITDGTVYSIWGDSSESFVDRFGDSLSGSYQYRIRAIDSCKQISKESHLGKTIFLTIKNRNNAYTVLTWNAYEHWPEGVDEYSIESSYDGNNWSAIEGLNGLSYQDERRTLLEHNQVFYRIKAVNKHDATLMSFSNVVKVNTATTLFIPNAFSPNGDGVNDVFKVGTYGLKSFRCQIFARSGQMVLQTNHPDNIWDGTSATGMALPAGAYTYIIQIEDVKGQVRTEKGSVMLIR